jgi:hypothetical protein
MLADPMNEINLFGIIQLLSLNWQRVLLCDNELSFVQNIICVYN